jgi:hypothetical protein
MRTVVQKSLIVAVATVLAIAFLWFWAMIPLTAGGPFFGSRDDPALIRRYFPMRVVQPEWIHGKHSLLMDWTFAETRVRSSIVLILWLACTVAIVYGYRRARQSQRI